MYGSYPGVDGPNPVARADMWELLPPTEPFDAYRVQWTYPPEDIERIRWGLIPEDMGDKWFIYAEGEELFIYHWGGELCFKVRITAEGIDQVRMARGMPFHEWQIARVRHIVEAGLIGLDRPFP